MQDRDSFVGQGWAFPPRFEVEGAVGKTALSRGLDEIRESLDILFGTEPGERAMRPGFGCALKPYLFEPIDAGLVGRLRGTITQALLEFEPRLVVDGVSIDIDEAVTGLLHIEVAFTVRATNNRHSYVYPFYLQEAIRPIEEATP